MADPEHIQIVLAGRPSVMNWHRTNGGKCLDLDGANLMGRDLSGAFFHYASLVDADLRGARIVGARFSYVTLDSAKFDDALIEGTIFTDAFSNNLSLRRTTVSHSLLASSIFNGANCLDAIFRHATFSDVDLKNANFRGVQLDSTVFANVNLSGVMHLESVRHNAPSSVGLDTIVRSKPMLSQIFLRGCGIPDAVAQHLPMLVGSMEPIQFYSCFISYSHKDEEFAKRFHSRLEQAKLRVWYAPEDMAGGKQIVDQVEEAIRLHEKLLLVLSDYSMNSEWVKTEIRKARDREIRHKHKVLFPIRLVPFDKIKSWKAFDADSGKDMAVEIREFYIPDFSNWKDHDVFESEFAKLLRDLKKSTENNENV